VILNVMCLASVCQVDSLELYGYSGLKLLITAACDSVVKLKSLKFVNIFEF